MGVMLGKSQYYPTKVGRDGNPLSLVLLSRARTCPFRCDCKNRGTGSSRDNGFLGLKGAQQKGRGCGQAVRQGVP